MKSLALPAFLAALLTLSACGFRHEKNPGDGIESGSTPTSNPNPNGRAIEVCSFSELKAKVLEPKCMDCHKGFGDYSKVFAERDGIRQRVFVETDFRRVMPRGDKLDADQANMLRTWLEAGAPEQGTEPAPATPPAAAVPVPMEQLAPTWANVQKHFFACYCASCHQANSDVSDLDLSDLKATRDHAAKILDLVIVRQKMPPKNSTYGPIGADDLHLLVDWIAARMPGPDGQPAPAAP
jgi:mono/diheme cytochrome c family protein